MCFKTILRPRIESGLISSLRYTKKSVLSGAIFNFPFIIGFPDPRGIVIAERICSVDSI